MSNSPLPVTVVHPSSSSSPPSKFEIKKNCPSTPEKKRVVNGNDMSMTAIAARADTILVEPMMQSETSCDTDLEELHPSGTERKIIVPPLKPAPIKGILKQPRPDQTENQDPSVSITESPSKVKHVKFKDSFLLASRIVHSTEEADTDDDNHSDSEPSEDEDGASSGQNGHAVDITDSEDLKEWSFFRQLEERFANAQEEQAIVYPPLEEAEINKQKNMALLEAYAPSLPLPKDDNSHLMSSSGLPPITLTASRTPSLPRLACKRVIPSTAQSHKIMGPIQFNTATKRSAPDDGDEDEDDSYMTNVPKKRRLCAPKLLPVFSRSCFPEILTPAAIQSSEKPSEDDSDRS